MVADIFIYTQSDTQNKPQIHPRYCNLPHSHLHNSLYAG